MLFARPLAVTSPLRLAASAAAVAVLATATAARMPVQPAEAAVIRPLTLGYDQDVYGDFLLAGNGNMRSPSTSADGTTLATCATAATRGKTTVNDNYDMQWADVDGVAATYNSSRAALTIPTGARVDFARLSWAGNTGQISGTTLVACGARQTQVGVAADLPPGGVTAQTNAVKLTVGSGTAASYTPGTSYVTDPGSGSDSSATYYSAFRDVTAQFSGVATVSRCRSPSPTSSLPRASTASRAGRWCSSTPSTTRPPPRRSSVRCRSSTATSASCRTRRRRPPRSPACAPRPPTSAWA